MRVSASGHERRKIVDAAVAMLRENPAAPFSHETIAEKTGIAARTIYRHFPTRADLTAAFGFAFAMMRAYVGPTPSEAWACRSRRCFANSKVAAPRNHRRSPTAEQEINMMPLAHPFHVLPADGGRTNEPLNIVGELIATTPGGFAGFLSNSRQRLHPEGCRISRWSGRWHRASSPYREW